MSSEKRERFLKLAPKRTQKILDMLRLLGNCANRSNYEYTDTEIKKIFQAIRKETNLQEEKFRSKKEEKLKRFTL